MGHHKKLTAFQTKAKKEVKNEAKNTGLNMCGTAQTLVELARFQSDCHFDCFNFGFVATPQRPFLERRNAEVTVPRVGDILNFHIEYPSQQCGLQRSNATAGNGRVEQQREKARLARATIVPPRYYVLEPIPEEENA
jgi:hypothetical protein